jgi:amino-acid N-acetyltransferase
MALSYRQVQTDSDFTVFCDAIKQAMLPYTDLNYQQQLLFIFYDNQQNVVGTGGLDSSGVSALLRSITVNPNQQGQRLGQEIVQTMLWLARERNIEVVYLLTQSAAFFFEKLGFETIDRSQAPAEISGTTEFAGVCPASATCMMLRF